MQQLKVQVKQHSTWAPFMTMAKAAVAVGAGIALAVGLMFLLNVA